MGIFFNWGKGGYFGLGMGPNIGPGLGLQVTHCLSREAFFKYLPDLGPNTLKSIQIHYNYFH